MPDETCTGAVIIGRNEGDRLRQCLAAVPAQIGTVIYVDSGSTDGSPEAARAAGADVLALDLSTPFTAARARNAGLERLVDLCPDVAFVQFIDGDCALREGWIETALAFLADHPQVAVACGRRRERFPDASVYNRICDKEWDTPVGQSKACGGDALMRIAAFQEVGGFDPSLIAGEEPELCVRLRARGWQIWRLDREMTWHDAAITRFSQWWKRTRRGGFAFAQGAAMHGAPPERHWVLETRRAVIWGLGLPGAILAATALIGPWGLVGLFLYPAQMLRILLRERETPGAVAYAVFTVLGKFPEALGVLHYRRQRQRGADSALIEYK